nr:Aspartyl protease [uncultured bacterium]
MSKLIYPVQHYKNLFIVNAAIGSLTTQPKVIRLLVDTGASYTLISRKILISAGYDLENVPKKLTIIAASGNLQAPIIQLNWFNCLGSHITDLPTLAWDLPPGINTSGLLGMDFLTRLGAVIDISNGAITV